MTVPVLELREPHKKEYFDVTEIEGIRFHVPKRITTEAGKLEFVLDSMLLMKRVDVKGFKLKF